MTRALSIGLAVVLGIGVIAAIGISVLGKVKPGSTTPTLVVKGVIGSEKQPFFADADVQAAFHAHGLDVRVDTAGSRQIATSTDLSKYDFAFPAGEPQGVKIKTDRKAATLYQPFYTPMVVATFKPIADLLVADKVAANAGSYYTIDIAAYEALVAKNTRWSDLPNNTAYSVGKSILVTSTDVRTSNSAAMYLAIASYVANGNNIVQGTAQADAVLPVVEPLFLRQGFTQTSSEGPFNDYLTIGIGKEPLVMIYESQFVARAAARDGSITKEKVLMYPSPGLFSKHTLVPLDSKGDQVGQLLQNDAKLRTLEIQYGFRTSDSAAFKQFASSHGVSLPDTLANAVDPPTYEVLEYMISTIEKKIGGQ
ncbi:MAG TPA: hypothetical protein VNV65_11460 [Candidatus Solibacter sp.]|nr:hypothetical protein [Candidatus Solibacter sp.]